MSDNPTTTTRLSRADLERFETAVVSVIGKDVPGNVVRRLATEWLDQRRVLEQIAEGRYDNDDGMVKMYCVYCLSYEPDHYKKCPTALAQGALS